MKRLLLIRHTPVATEPGTCYGWQDVALAETFAKDKEAVKQALIPHLEDQDRLCFYTSPSMRAYLLAEYLAGRHKPIHDARLREIHFGNWEGRFWGTIPEAELNPWMQDYANTPAPGGESYQLLTIRANAFFAELWTNQSIDTAIVVTHKGIILSYLAQAAQVSLAESFNSPLAQIPFGSIYAFYEPLQPA